MNNQFWGAGLLCGTCGSLPQNRRFPVTISLVHKFYDNPIERKAPPEARVPASFTIGNVKIAPAPVLAPMAGVTDTVFRRFIREMTGCGLLMTEFTSADGVQISDHSAAATRSWQ